MTAVAASISAINRCSQAHCSCGEVIEEYNGSTLNKQYVYGNGIDEVFNVKVLTGAKAGSYYYHTDGIGSVTAITDKDGNIVERIKYGIYGVPTILDATGTEIASSSIGNEYMFQGRRFDKSLNMYHYRARAYDPTTGRFLQNDPLGYIDSMNLYQGMNMNPYNFVDPEGLTLIYTPNSNGGVSVHQQRQIGRMTDNVDYLGDLEYDSGTSYVRKKDGSREALKKLEEAEYQYEKNLSHIHYGVDLLTTGLGVKAAGAAMKAGIYSVGGLTKAVAGGRLAAVNAKNLDARSGSAVWESIKDSLPFWGLYRSGKKCASLRQEDVLEGEEHVQDWYDKEHAKAGGFQDDINRDNASYDSRDGMHLGLSLSAKKANAGKNILKAPLAAMYGAAKAMLKKKSVRMRNKVSTLRDIFAPELNAKRSRAHSANAIQKRTSKYR